MYFAHDAAETCGDITTVRCDKLIMNPKQSSCIEEEIGPQKETPTIPQQVLSTTLISQQLRVLSQKPSRIRNGKCIRAVVKAN